MAVECSWPPPAEPAVRAGTRRATQEKLVASLRVGQDGGDLGHLAADELDDVLVAVDEVIDRSAHHLVHLTRDDDERQGGVRRSAALSPSPRRDKDTRRTAPRHAAAPRRWRSVM